MVFSEAIFFLIVFGSAAAAALYRLSCIERKHQLRMAPVIGGKRNNVKCKRKPILKNSTNEQQEENPDCCFCHRTENDPEKLGEKMMDKKTKLSAHYYCLIFSSGLWQNGQDQDGFNGFLIKDVKQEAEAASVMKCCICKKMGASITCNKPKCQRSFHFPCGQEKKCVFQFFDSFRSYCWEHAPVQRAISVQEKSQLCVICFDQLQPKPHYNVLNCPCCKQTWFHRACLQSQAQSSGLHHFKCPACSNKDAFVQEMLRMGICIPDRDASWELGKNAFSELYEEHQQCDVVKCLCTKGRTYCCKANSKWNIVRCHCCGSAGTHLVCSDLSSVHCNWICLDCFAIENKQKSEEEGPTGKKLECRATKNSTAVRVLQRVLKSEAQSGNSTNSSRSNLLPRAPTDTRLTRANTSIGSRVSDAHNNLRGVRQVQTRRTRRELGSKKGKHLR